MKKFGFTLAEVLITLGIIGVVAAITMPTLINNYKKHVFLNKLKQAYSIFNQAIIMSEANNGEVSEWDYSGTSSTLTQDIFFNKYLLPYLKIQKVPGLECGNNGYNCYKLSNGVRVFFWEREGFFDIRFDLNGSQPPNKNGKDQFALMLVLSKNCSFMKNQKIGSFVFRGAGLSLDEIKENCRNGGEDIVGSG